MLILLLILVFDVILALVGLLGVPLICVAVGFILIIRTPIFIVCHIPRFLIAFILLLCHILLLFEQLLLPLLFLLSLFLLSLDLFSEQWLVLEDDLLLQKNALVRILDVAKHLVCLRKLLQPISLQVQCDISSLHVLLVLVIKP